MEMKAGNSRVGLSRDEAYELLRDLALAMKEQRVSFRQELDEVHPDFQVSACNLLHYLLLRSREIRPLQQYLHESGLSSLTSSESHTLFQVLQVIHWLAGNHAASEFDSSEVCTFDQALTIREMHVTNLLGTRPRAEIPHIMVTLSPELAADSGKLAKLFAAGMSVVRINCGHEDEVVWAKMIKAVRKAASRAGKSCKIYMDLSGPRIRVADVPIRAKEHADGIVLSENDLVELSDIKDDIRKRTFKKDGSIKTLPRISLQPSGIISMLKDDERVFFDDGKFEAKVKSVGKKHAVVSITRISTKKPVLKKGKGVNLPDSSLAFSSLTDDDIRHLPFIAEHAELVGYSFVGEPADVQQLRQILLERGGNRPAIILKIERLSAVENLPALLLEGMKDKTFGVMIARGDLAVEIGFERLSEIQQQILWICEAAHVPVIWATQVLESMNKTGFATRSEITDAAMGGMAECVMLNKGKHVVKAVHTLADILARFTEHFDKKRFTFRPLSIATTFLKERTTRLHVTTDAGQNQQQPAAKGNRPTPD